jgi:hypothetical protein
MKEDIDRGPMIPFVTLVQTPQGPAWLVDSGDGTTLTLIRLTHWRTNNAMRPEEV